MEFLTGINEGVGILIQICIAKGLPESMPRYINRPQEPTFENGLL